MHRRGRAVTDEQPPEHLPAHPVDSDESAARSIQPIEYESAYQQLTVNVHPREVHFYTLSEQELDDLAAGNASANLGIACAGVGIVVTLLITLATVPLDPRAFGAAVGVLIAVLLVTIGFSMAAGRDWQQSHRLVERIKEQRRQRAEQ